LSNSGNAGTDGVTTSMGLSGTGSGNYSLTQPTLANVTINPATVTLSGTKTYDGTTGLSGTDVTISTGISGQSLTYTGATAYNANVSSGDYINAITLANGTGGVATNYQLPTLNAKNAPVTINPAPLTITPGTITKNYDGSSTAYLTSSSSGISDTTGGNTQTIAKNLTVTGFVTGQAESLNVSNGTYSRETGGVYPPNAGSSYSVSATISCSSFANTNSTIMSNYSINGVQLKGSNSTIITAPGSISPAPLTVTISNPPSKVYDGTDQATLGSSSMTFSGLVSGQGISLTSSITNAVYTISSSNAATVANVGTGYGVTAKVQYACFSPAVSTSTILANYSIGGAQIISGNSPFSVSGSGGSITPATLTATATPASMTYGGTVTALSGSLSNPTITSSSTPALSTLVTANWTTPVSSTSNVGSYSITPILSYGTNQNGTSVVSGDFSLSPAAGNATAMSVTPAPLTLTLSSISKTYDGSSNAYVVGSNTLETTNGLSQTVSPNITVSGFLNGNSATFTEATGSYSSGGSAVTNVGSGYSVAVPIGTGSFTVGSGTSLSNYSINGTQLTGSNVATIAGSGAITPATLGLSTTATKTFDGSSGIVLTGATSAFSGMPSGQAAGLNGNISASLSSSSVGSNLGGTVSLNTGDLTGNSAFLSALNAGDYLLPATFTGGRVFSASSSAIIPAGQVSSTEVSMALGASIDVTGSEVSALPSFPAPPVANFGSSLGGGQSMGGLTDDNSNIFDLNTQSSAVQSTSSDQTIYSIDSTYVLPAESQSLNDSSAGEIASSSGQEGGKASGEGKPRASESFGSLTVAGSKAAPYSLQVPTFKDSVGSVFESQESR